MAEAKLFTQDTPGMSTHDTLCAEITATLEALRAKRPRVHAVTSPVAQSLTANGLLALGATPSLTINADEIEEFILSADAVLLNLGMLDRERFEVLPLAAKIALAAEKPLIIDPVFADRSPKRRALARTLFSSSPAIVKLNTSEAEAFLRHIPDRTVLVITGAVDRIQIGRREARLANGHPLMASVTATGCLLGALLGACRSVEEDAFKAAIAGISILNIAAEIAAEGAGGPGSFAVRLIDALSRIDATAIHRHLKVEILRHEAP